MTGWLLILIAVVGLWIVWQMLNLIADLIEKAVRKDEDSSTTEGKGSFS